MAFPKNCNSIKKIIVEDPLHIVAIDFLFLELAPPRTANLQGIKSKNNRWILMNGIHNINYGNDVNNQPCYLRANCDKDMYTIEFSGDEPTKTLIKVLNAKRITITNESFIREIDIFIMKEKNMLINGGFTTNIVSVPLDNIYALNKANEKGYMILQKESIKNKHSYTIDIVGAYYNNIIDNILNGNADRIRVLNCSVITEQIFVRFMDKTPLQNIHPSQQTIIDYVIDTYSNSITKNVTILITGVPGGGKSTVAFGITQIMKKRLAVDPYLVKGFNINCEEIQYHPIINQYSPKDASPVILLLDEIDIALKNANSDKDDNKAHAISANKTNLNNFLDAINDEQFLITVATTNMDINQINNQYGVYCRKGRFNKHFEIISHDLVNIIDPI
jgi:hypothetical protein